VSSVEIKSQKFMTTIIVAERPMLLWLHSFNLSLNLLDYHRIALGELPSPLFREFSAADQESQK
jgi:hypothetical protein